MDPNLPINPVTPNEQPAPQPTPIPHTQPQPTPVQPSQPAPVSQAPATPAPAKKSNKTLIIILCAIIGIIAVAAVVMVLLMNKQPQKTSTNNSNTSSNVSPDIPEDDETCGNKQKIVGVWESTSKTADKYTYAFDSNGSGIAVSEGTETETFEYTVTCTTLKAKIWGLEKTLDIEFDENKMTLSDKEDEFGYSATFKHVSDNPEDISEYIENDHILQSANDVKRRNHLALILSQSLGYIANNRKAPKTENDFKLFVKNYIDDDYKTDPDGTDYQFKFAGECKSEESCWGKGNEKGIKKPSKLDHSIYYFYNAKCNDNNDIERTEQSKSIVFYYILENKDAYCVSNS